MKPSKHSLKCIIFSQSFLIFKKTFNLFWLQAKIKIEKIYTIKIHIFINYWNTKLYNITRTDANPTISNPLMSGNPAKTTHNTWLSAHSLLFFNLYEFALMRYTLHLWTSQSISNMSPALHTLWTLPIACPPLPINSLWYNNKIQQIAHWRVDATHGSRA